MSVLQAQLKSLFLMDQQVRGLRKRLDAATRRLLAQERRLAEFLQQRKELETQHKHARAGAGGLEDQANGARDKVEKLRSQMNSVTSNKEYKALLVEMNTLKLEQSRLEDEALNQLNAAEQMQLQLEALTQQASNQQSLVDLARRDVEEARQEVGDRLDQAVGERERTAAELDPVILATFEKMTDAYDGEGVAEVEAQDLRRREFLCAGCFMQLPVEVVNALIVKPQALSQCPNCERILLMPDALKEMLAVKSASTS